MTPPVMNYIKVWVNATPTTGFTEMFEAKLPQKESWYQVQKMLRTSVDIHVAGEGYRQGPGGKWKYQLVSRDLKRVINKASVYLNTDQDYLILVDTVKASGKETPVAVLTQEKAEAATAPTASTGVDPSHARKMEAESAVGAPKGMEKTPASEEGVWYEGPTEEPLDEDGNPFFDPYDPEQTDRVAATWAEGHTGFTD